MCYLTVYSNIGHEAASYWTAVSNIGYEAPCVI